MIDMHLNPVRTAADGERLRVLNAAAVADESGYLMPRLQEAGFDRGVMVILSDRALDDLEDPGAAGRSRLAAFSPFIVAALAIDFRRPDAVERLERASRLGVAALKFHPYLQEIVTADFPAAVALAREAERLGMFVMVCCSYGTRALDRHDGVRLTAALAGVVRCPIVMSHGGGRQVLDAMLVAADAPQVLLETSYSLPYYVGSSIETDFAFAIRKLGASRWMYGSDLPFVAMEDSLSIARHFFARHGFPDGDVDQILHDTAAALLDRR